MRRLRNVKIVATLGPAPSDYDTIRALFEAGADVFRLNMSHGTHEDIAARHAIIRQVEEDIGRPIGILADLQGPKLRVGVFANGAEELVRRRRLPHGPRPGRRRRRPREPAAPRDFRGAGTRALASGQRRQDPPARSTPAARTSPIAP